MANDRMYLVCRSCNQAVTIWKHYPSGGYSPLEEWESAQGRLGRFIAAHLEEHDKQYVNSFGPMAPFYTATESTPLDITMWMDTADTTP